MLQRPSQENPPPLKVYYPFGGKRFLLNWWTYKSRGHLFIANNEEQMKQMFSHLKFGDDTRVLAIQEVEIVAPSRSMSYEAALRDYEQEVENFYVGISYELRKLVSWKILLPKMFKECRHDGDDKYDCDTCQGSCVKLVGMTTEELYLAYVNAWEEQFGKPKVWEDKNLAPSQAVPADDSEVDKLHMASGNYGHHRDAIHLAPMSEGYSRRDALFYYRLIRELDQSEYDQRIAFRQEEIKRDRKVQQDAGHQKHLDEERKQAEDVCRFFRFFGV